MPRLMNRHPGRPLRLGLILLPFAILLLLYLFSSQARLAENPNDKLLPSFSQMSAAVERMAFTEDRRSGAYLWWDDSAASLKRLGSGLAISAAISLVLGLAMLIPLLRTPLSPLVTVISMIPPLAILPILFIVMGLGELSKVMLIVIGITPVLIRDLQQRVAEIPAELLIKAQTLGANSWQVLIRVVLPQLLPRLLQGLCLALGPAWLFLIAAEAIASTEGLGYRIFLVRRYLAMDVILPYVAWITLLAFCMDRLLKGACRLLFPWFEPKGGH